jgi:2-deoxy-D-gluconate 3-dehydrogenase
MTTISEFDLTGKVALVTGAAGLLGVEFSRTLAQAGASVALVDIDAAGISAVESGLHDQGYAARAIQTDITDPESVQNMISETIEEFYRVDILINSAALDPKFDPASRQSSRPNGAFEDYPLEAWQQALDVNLTGMFLVTQAVCKRMLEQGGGVVINLSSIYGITAPDQRLYEQDGVQNQYKPAYYSVTKTGVLGFTRYLAAYYAGKNIRVNAISPGGVFNNHAEEFVQAYSHKTVLGRMAKKDDMNGALLFLASDASRYVTGENLVVDGGWSIW